MSFDYSLGSDPHNAHTQSGVKMYELCLYIYKNLLAYREFKHDLIVKTRAAYRKYTSFDKEFELFLWHTLMSFTVLFSDMILFDRKPKGHQASLTCQAALDHSNVEEQGQRERVAHCCRTRPAQRHSVCPEDMAYDTHSCAKILPSLPFTLPTGCINKLQV